MNKIILIGYVGQDPKQTDNYVQFSIATSEKWTGEDGQKKERTDWHNCTAFNKTGETVMKYVHKGSRLYVEGKQRNTAKEINGEKKYYSSVTVEKIEFLDKKDDNGPGSIPVENEPVAHQRSTSSVGSIPYATQNMSAVPTDEDVPF